MRDNDVERELSEVPPYVWLILIGVAGAALAGLWGKTIGPIVNKTVDAVKAGAWTETVGALPIVGEVTAATIVGLFVALLFVLFMIGRLIRKVFTGRREDRDR